MVLNIVISKDDLPLIRRKHTDKTVVLVFGVFDLLHPGHIELFRRIKQMADISVVALFCDNRVRQKKSQLHPIYNQEIRQELVDAVKYVDYCLIAPEFNGMERPTEQVLRNLRPDIFATSDSTWQEHIEIFNELNIKLVIIPRLRDDISTTQTIEKIQSLKTE